MTHQEKEEQLRRLMTLYLSPIKRLCLVYLRDDGLAEDAAQETFVKAWRALDAFRGESAEKTWLTRIAVNTCKDMLRSGYLRHVDRHWAPDAWAETATGLSPDALALTDAVAALPPKYRDAVLLCYWQGLTTREAASALHLPQQTLAWRLKKAKTLLKTALEGEDLHE